MSSGITETVNAIKSNGIISKIMLFLGKINRKTITDIIIIAIPIFLIYIYIVGITPPEVKETLKQNKQIDKKIDTLKRDNEFIVQRIYEIEKSQQIFFDLINKNNELIEENNNQLMKIKKIYNEKIKSINGYNVSQLDSFFANRYKEYYR